MTNEQLDAIIAAGSKAPLEEEEDEGTFTDCAGCYDTVRHR
jgi:hypothetical protein